MSETNPAPYYDDEISISELLMKLWAKRGLIVMLPLIFAGLTVVALLFGKTATQNEVSFYIELNGIVLSDTASDGDDGSGSRTRPDRISDSMSGGSATTSSSTSSSSSSSSKKITTRYPNGTIFSPQDLTNPTVITLLAEDTGLNPQDLAKAIDVQFGTPLSNGVLAEYKAALSANSKASTEDLIALNARYQSKLDAAAKRGIKIMVDYVDLGVPLKEGERIAELLPKLWNTVYTEQFATQISPEIATLRWTSYNFDVTSAIGLQEADIQLTNLKKGVELLAADHRLRGVKSFRGTTAADLNGYVDEFRSIFFDPLSLYAFNRDDTLTRIYAQDLRFEIQELDKEISELNERLAEVRRFQGGARSGAAANGGARDTAQLDGSALSAVVNLAEQAALSSYLQESLDTRFELNKQRATLSTRLERITSDTVSGQVSESFIETAVTRYETITSSYADILTKAQAVLQANTPSFYNVMTQPDTEGSLIAKRDLLFIALALALGGMLAIIAALVWPKPEGAS